MEEGGQKRTYEESSTLLDKANAILLDIEGTTTPVSFVKDKLVPYARDNVDKYLTKNYLEDEVKKAISALRDLAKKDKEDGVEGVIEIPEEDASKEDIVKAVSDNVKWQMESDRKSTELKTLQGLIWKVGYENKELKGELYQDVGPMLKMLAAEGLSLYIYSSGSIEAQKQLFEHSSFGDLSSIISGHFDTTTGQKTDKASYTKIAEEINNETKDVLFLTDSIAEAQASRDAGMNCILVNRDPDNHLSHDILQKFICIERFDELYGDEEDEEDIKRFAGDNGEADDDDEDDDDDADDDDDDADNDDDDDNPEDA